MSNFSRFLSPPYNLSEDDAPPFCLGSHAVWSPAPSGNHSLSAGHDADDSAFPDETPMNYPSRNPGFSRQSASHYHSHPTHASDDRRSHSRIHISSDDPDTTEANLNRLHKSRPTRASEDHHSHSHISISSDDPNPIEVELIRLREEIDRLKAERTQSQRDFTEHTYVFDILCHMGCSKSHQRYVRQTARDHQQKRHRNKRRSSQDR